MKNLLLNIYSKVAIKSERTKNIAKHIGWSMFFKVGSIIANFLLVPLTINYLDTENYGVWLVLSSFISWFSFFDIGLGNGLRNKFAESKTLGNHKDAQAFVSTAYFTIGLISLLIAVVFLGVNQFIDWTNLFNTNESLKNDLNILLPIIFSFFALQLVVKLITSIYQADQNHSIQGKIQFFGQVLSLVVIYFLTKINQSSLLLFGAIFSALPVMILIGLNTFAFNTIFKAYKPKLSLWKKEYLKEIMGLGFNFFIIQIAALVLFSTDNFIVTKLFSPKEVVPYNISFKFYSILTMGYTILVSPFWSAFTEAFTKKDYEWIKKSVKNIQRIWLLIPIGLIVLILISDWFYELWVGDKVTVPMSLNFSMALFVLLSSFNMIYSFFLNGVGKLRLQLYTAILSIIINIPLSILFVRTFGLGLSGVILATCFSMSYSTVLKVIQYNKIINNRATKIWAK